MSAVAAPTLRRPPAPRRRALSADGPATAHQITTPAAIPGGIR
ncbi:hypothetical protein [Streptomyces sioyaensis]|nr:hypothetical protein [Streptomyces sioyaensis]